MTTSEDLLAAWVAEVVVHCGSVILAEFDPATQPTMQFHPRSWSRWNPRDSDVAWAIDQYPDGIHRRDLWALAKDLETAVQRRRAFVATLLWGAGTTNRYYGRHTEALASDKLPSVLEDTVTQVGRNDLEGAWSTAARLPGLDFRFFTKWLWVAGVGAGLKAPPLVFDQRVRDSLLDAAWPWDHRRINDRRRWVNYCQDAAAVGAQLGVTGEWIEHWLFSSAPGADRLTTPGTVP